MKRLFVLSTIAMLSGATFGQQVSTLPVEPAKGGAQSSTGAQSATADLAPPKTSPTPQAKVVQTVRHPVPRAKPAPAKPFDPTDVHPNVAVHQPIQREIVLPGVMRIDGAQELLNANKRKIVAAGQTLHVVYLSKDDSNLISTPFPKPIALFSKGLATISIEGNNVFVNIEETTNRPFMIWLKDADDNTNVIGLQVTPKKNLSAQLVTVVLEGKVGGALPVGASDPQQAAIAEKLSHLAQGKKPQGYAFDDVSDYPLVTKNSLLIKPMRRYSSSNDDIWEYEVKNASTVVATVSKTDFCSGGNQGGECDPSILAVSIFPVDTLAPGQHTRAFVVVAKGTGTGEAQ